MHSVCAGVVVSEWLRSAACGLLFVFCGVCVGTRWMRTGAFECKHMRYSDNRHVFCPYERTLTQLMCGSKISTMHIQMTGRKEINEAPLLKLGMHAEIAMRKSRSLCYFFSEQILAVLFV